MATLTMSVDGSDCSAVIAAVAALADKLRQDDALAFQAEVRRLIAENRAFVFDRDDHSPAVLTVLASADLLDLMRRFERKLEDGR